MKKELCQQLLELSKLEPFQIKARAYYRGYRAIKLLPEQEVNSRLNFLHINGIGTGIDNKIKEFKTSGKISKLEKLKNQFDSSVKIKKTGNIIKVPIEKAEEYISPYRKYFDSLPFIKQYEVCGSFRRKKSFVADADFLICTGQSEEVWKSLKKILGSQQNVTAEGTRKISFVEAHGFQIDINFCSSEEWGASLMHHTGSSRYNIYCRELAQKRGWSLNQYGLWAPGQKGLERIAGRTEDEITQMLHILYELPEERD